MKSLYFVVCLLLIILFQKSGHCQNTIVYDDIHHSQTLSTEQHKPLILIFSADYCQFCQNLKDDIFVSKIIEDKIICVIDVQKNKKIARDFKIRILPTSVLLDDEFVEKSRIVGYNKNQYIQWINDSK